MSRKAKILKKRKEKKSLSATQFFCEALWWDGWLKIRWRTAGHWWGACRLRHLFFLPFPSRLVYPQPCRAAVCAKPLKQHANLHSTQLPAGATGISTTFVCTSCERHDGNTTCKPLSGREIGFEIDGEKMRICVDSLLFAIESTLPPHILLPVTCG